MRAQPQKMIEPKTPDLLWAGQGGPFWLASPSPPVRQIAMWGGRERYRLGREAYLLAMRTGRRYQDLAYEIGCPSKGAFQGRVRGYYLLLGHALERRTADCKCEFCTTEPWAEIATEFNLDQE